MKRFILSQLLVLALAASLIAQGGLAVYERRAVVAAGGATVSSTTDTVSRFLAPAAASLVTASTFDAGTGDLILCLAYGAAVAPTTASCGANTLTALTGIDGTVDTNYYHRLFYIASAASLTNAACTVNYDGSASYRNIMCGSWSKDGGSGWTIGASACESAGCNTLAASSTNITTQNMTTTARAAIIVMGLTYNFDRVQTGANGYAVDLDGAGLQFILREDNDSGSHPGGTVATLDVADPYSAVVVEAQH